MRSIGDQAAVRLYRLDADGGIESLFYGPLAQALAEADRVASDHGAGGAGELYVQTANDVVALDDLLRG